MSIVALCKFTHPWHSCKLFQIQEPWTAEWLKLLTSDHSLTPDICVGIQIPTSSDEVITHTYPRSDIY